MDMDDFERSGRGLLRNNNSLVEVLFHLFQKPCIASTSLGRVDIVFLIAW
jgi:hypothetical protein